MRCWIPVLLASLMVVGAGCDEDSGDRTAPPDNGDTTVKTVSANPRLLFKEVVTRMVQRMPDALKLDRVWEPIFAKNKLELSTLDFGAYYSCLKDEGGVRTRETLSGKIKNHDWNASSQTATITIETMWASDSVIMPSVSRRQYDVSLAWDNGQFVLEKVTWKKKIQQSEWEDFGMIALERCPIVRHLLQGSVQL